MLNVHEVKKVYIYEYDYNTDEDGQSCCKVGITTDEKTQNMNEFRLISIDELEEFIGLGFDVIDVVETLDGIYGFYKIEYIDGFGDKEHYGSYVKIGESTDWKIRDFKSCLDRSKNT